MVCFHKLSILGRYQPTAPAVVLRTAHCARRWTVHAWTPASHRDSISHRVLVSTARLQPLVDGTKLCTRFPGAHNDLIATRKNSDIFGAFSTKTNPYINYLPRDSTLATLPLLRRFANCTSTKEWAADMRLAQLRPTQASRVSPTYRMSCKSQFSRQLWGARFSLSRFPTMS